MVKWEAFECAICGAPTREDGVLRIEWNLPGEVCHRDHRPVEIGEAKAKWRENPVTAGFMDDAGRAEASMEEPSEECQIDFEQAEQLSRVRSKIGKVVLEFCQRRVGKSFHSQDLAEFVEERAGSAPASPDRVLRDLRRRGLVDYRVVSRAKSLYEILSVG